MIGIVIAAVFLALILLVLLLPIRAFLSFKKNLTFTVKLSFFRLYPSGGSVKQKKDDHESKTTQKKAEKDKHTFRRLFRKRGATEGIKELFVFASKVLKSLRKLLKHITFHQICFRLAVATGDAATTAVTYGEICTAAYPCFAFLDQASNVKYKDISIFTDFTASEMKPEFSAVISTRVIFLLAAACKIFLEYLSFRKQVNNNE